MNDPVHLSKFWKVLPSGAEWPIATRDWVILQLCDGAAYVLAGELKKELAMFEVLVCPPLVTLKLLGSVLGNASFRGLAIRVSSLTGVLTAMERHCLETDAARQLAPFVTLPATYPMADRLAQLFGNDSAMCLSNRLAFVQTFAELLAPQLREATKKEGLAVPGEQDAKSRLMQLINRMPESELATFSLNQLAQKIHSCERHASRLFQGVWGESFRSFISELRLKKACQLLVEGKLKIIDVALESGHGSLAHFNYVFKRHFRLTPTEWRSRHLKGSPYSALATGKSDKAQQKVFSRRSGVPAAKAAVAALGRPFVRPSGKPILPPCQPPRTVAATMPSVAALVLMLLLFSGVSTALAREAAPVQNSVTNQAPTAVAGPRFKVDRYVVEGNTLLSTNLIAKILAPYTGSAVGLDGIKKAGGALQLAYRERGYPTVAVGLPQQKISNGIVRFKVTEGELTSISVVHNRFFSSNNVMRSLPSLGFTNSSRILNGKIFQAELDRANANKDRQIYPEVRPGPEPGTSELVLDVKDRLPLHGKLEFDNYSPPNTPNDRVNLNLSYENLWQLEHTIGFQYGASPERLKETLDVPNMVLAPVDWPAVAYYSAFYRAPLGPPEAIGTEIARDPSQFGYNEATHQFVLPPSSGRPGVTLYANRTTTGTALDVGPYQLVTQSSLETIDQQAFSESLTSQTTAGVRLTLPLPNFWGISSSFSFGTDYKYYESATLATNFFSFTTVITNSEGHRVITHSTNSIVGNTSPSVDYMPISFSWTGSRPDRFGEYDGSFGVEAGTSGWFHPDQKYPQAIVYSRKADMDFVALRPQISRSQHLPDNWTFYANLAAQWANEPLINLEESPLGGVSTVPGYKEGERYGDSGWLLQVELRSPTVWFGKLGAGKLFGAEMTGFSDYGQSHQLDPPPGEKTIEALWGSGVGLNFFLGANVESHLLVAWALRDGDYTKSGSERVSFSVSGQF